MKKLMIAACAVAVSVVANAASITWESDTISDLVIGGDAVAIDEGQVNWILFENTEAYTMGNIWDAYKAGTLAGTKIGEIDTDTAMYWMDPGMMQMAGGDGTKEGDVRYFASIMLYNAEKDFENPTYYMVNTGSIAASDAGATLQDIGNTIGGSLGSGDTVWTSTAAVPEPTSGLLLLLGVAGLALRRRRA